MIQSPKVVLITQARMTSTRLPAKVLKEVLGKSLLEYQIERLRQVCKVHEIVVATTLNATDEPIVALCEKLGVSCFRGPEDDVLSRYYGASVRFKADVVVRVTSDCPLIDPIEIDRLLEFYFDSLDRFDYVSNRRTYPTGMDAEVFSFPMLQRAFEQATLRHDREHVTPFFYNHEPSHYRVGFLDYPKNEREQRWTVDTPEDFELISRILESLYPTKPLFTMEDIFDLLKTYPHWTEINQHIRAKKLGE